MEHPVYFVLLHDVRIYVSYLGDIWMFLAWIILVPRVLVREVTIVKMILDLEDKAMMQRLKIKLTFRIDKEIFLLG